MQIINRNSPQAPAIRRAFELPDTASKPRIRINQAGSCTIRLTTCSSMIFKNLAEACGYVRRRNEQLQHLKDFQEAQAISRRGRRLEA